MSREVSTSSTAKHKGQARRACTIRMVWGTEVMVCVWQRVLYSKFISSL